jgi:hypothetical protein
MTWIVQRLTPAAAAEWKVDVDRPRDGGVITVPLVGWATCHYVVGDGNRPWTEDSGVYPAVLLDADVVVLHPDAYQPHGVKSVDVGQPQRGWHDV